MFQYIFPLSLVTKLLVVFVFNEGWLLLFWTFYFFSGSHFASFLHMEWCLNLFSYIYNLTTFWCDGVSLVAVIAVIFLLMSWLLLIMCSIVRCSIVLAIVTEIHDIVKWLLLTSSSQTTPYAYWKCNRFLLKWHITVWYQPWIFWRLSLHFFMSVWAIC